MITCEYCLKEHEGKYGSGRFCRKECSRAFSTKAKRKEINERVAKKLRNRDFSFLESKRFTGRKHTEESKLKISLSLKICGRRISDELVFVINSSYPNVAKSRAAKIIPDICTLCGLKAFWQGKVLRLQIDHINGDKKDSRWENLRKLCPNCHSQTETWGCKFHTEETKKKISLTKRHLSHDIA
jgi:hypothetical protein